jgi:hypothetical protein
MITPRVTRALNPHRRKLTLKQIRAGFGGKRRQASLKASRHTHKRPKAKASNPKKHRKRATAKAKNQTKVVYRTKYKTKKVYVKSKPKAKAKRRSSNPGQYLLTMAPVGANPHHKKRRKTSMAKTKRRASAKGHSGKRRNPTRRAYKRKSNHRPRSRNPFGEGSSALLKKGFGVFVGFSAAKKVPPMLGASMNSSPMMSLLSTAITAGVLAWAAKKFIPGPIAEGVLWGGAAGVINVAWNNWAPASIAGYAGVGDFVPGGFPLPQGPVRFPMVAAPQVTPTGSAVNLSAFYGPSGRAW